MALREVALLVPVASLLHVLKEWPRFPRWVRRFASDSYSDREYLALHVAGVGTALAVHVAEVGHNLFKRW